MSDGIKKILDMISNGTITQKEGEELIEAVYKKEKPAKNAGKKRMLRVRIKSKETSVHDETTVNVNVPLVLAKKISGLTKLVPKSAKSDLAEEGIDLDAINLVELIELFENGDIDEDLVTIDTGDGEETTKVRIYVD